MTARCDGQTEWYEAYTSAAVFSEVRAFAVQLLGAGPGRCLEIACGAARSRRWSRPAGVVSTDRSAHQLEAAGRSAESIATIVQADAHELPFGDASFDAVLSILTHTDLDDPVRLALRARA